MWKFLSRIANRHARRSSDEIFNAQMPAMITPEEGAFYEECARDLSGKHGFIVDLGCWLGGTSVALARGITNTHPEKVLGFDRFRWEAWMPANIPYSLYQPGDSFLPEARRLSHDHAGEKIELIEADLTTYEWKDGPIKLLLVDAMKNETLTAQIAKSFYPSLRVGALLIHQDFKHFHTSWIHLLQYELRKYFRLHCVVPDSTTVAFEVQETIPTAAVKRATAFRALSDDEIDESFRYSIELVGEDDCANIAAAHVMHYLHLGRKDRARATMDRYREMEEKGELAVVAKRLKDSKTL